MKKEGSMNRTITDLANVLGITPNTLAIQAREGLHDSIGVAKPKGWKRYMYVVYAEKVRSEFGQEVYDRLYKEF